MLVAIFIYIYTHTYTHTRIYLFIYKYMCIYINAYICIYINIYINIQLEKWNSWAHIFIKRRKVKLKGCLFHEQNYRLAAHCGHMSHLLAPIANRVGGLLLLGLGCCEVLKSRTVLCWDGHFRVLRWLCRGYIYHVGIFVSCYWSWPVEESWQMLFRLKGWK